MCLKENLILNTRELDASAPYFVAWLDINGLPNGQIHIG